MAIFNLYIFDRVGTCLHYAEWQRKKLTNMPKEEEYKLMYGMIYSLKSFVSRMSPVDPYDKKRGVCCEDKANFSDIQDNKDAFFSYNTNRYKLHFYESPSGIKLVMNTDMEVQGRLKDCLHRIYQIFVDYVVKNPLTDLGEPVESELFTSQLSAYVKSLPFYN